MFAIRSPLFSASNDKCKPGLLSLRRNRTSVNSRRIVRMLYENRRTNNVRISVFVHSHYLLLFVSYEHICRLLHLRSVSSSWLFWLVLAGRIFITPVRSIAVFRRYSVRIPAFYRAGCILLWPRYNFPLQTARSASHLPGSCFPNTPLLQCRKTCSMPCEFLCVSSPFLVLPQCNH